MADITQLIQEKGYYYTSNTFDVLIQDPTSDLLIAHADALSESSFDITTEMTEKRGGPQNAILFFIPASKTLAVSMTNIAFDETWLSLQTGEQFSIGNFTIFGQREQCNITNTSGVRTIELSKEPAGKYVYVKSGTNNIPVLIDSTTPSVIDVTDITGVEDTCLDVVYAAIVKVKQLSIKSDTSPAVVKITMFKTVINGSTGKPIKKLYIVIPRFQLDGNLSLAGTLGDSDTMGLSGSAIAANSTQCGDSTQVLADVFVEDLDEDGLRPMLIETAESFEVEVGNTKNINVIARLGANLVYADYDVTTECTYVSDDTSIATVSAVGLITGVATGTANVAITHSSGVKTITIVDVI